MVSFYTSLINTGREYSCIQFSVKMVFPSALVKYSQRKNGFVSKLRVFNLQSRYIIQNSFRPRNIFSLSDFTLYQQPENRTLFSR